ncbi:unnamed protein product, partial [Prorocentrum cordatum]
MQQFLEQVRADLKSQTTVSAHCVLKGQVQRDLKLQTAAIKTYLGSVHGELKEQMAANKTDLDNVNSFATAQLSGEAPIEYLERIREETTMQKAAAKTDLDQGTNHLREQKAELSADLDKINCQAKEFEVKLGAELVELKSSALDTAHPPVAPCLHAKGAEGLPPGRLEARIGAPSGASRKLLQHRQRRPLRVWLLGAPVPLRVAVVAGGLGILLGDLAVLLVRAFDCARLVSVQICSLILASLGGVKYLVLSPNEGMSEEEIDMRSVLDFGQAGTRGGLPTGLRAAKGQPDYRFKERPRGAALQSWIMVRLAPGETADEAARAFVATAALDAVRGMPTPPPAEGARALEIKRGAACRCFGDLKSVVDSSGLCEFEDWVLSGPRTTLYVEKEIAKQSGGPVHRHAAWKHENKLDDDEQGVVAHEMLSESLELACTHGQVDATNLASWEELARHLQVLGHKTKKKKETIKEFDGQDYCLGRARRTRGAIIGLELLKWVAESAARDSANLKEERKATEEIGRRSAVGRRVNDCIAALNNLHGEGDFCSKARPSEAQFSAVDTLWQAVSGDKPPDNAPSPEAALVELLGTGSLGYGSDGPTVVAPHDRGLVSWPESAGCVSLLEVLPEPDRQEVIDGKNSMMLRAEEVRPGATKVYWDKTLQSNADEYMRFVQDLLDRGMVELRTRREFEVGVFFVRKKSGRLRLIVDARAVNQALKRPPTIHMASTAALVNMEVEGGAQLEFSIQDIADCFYQFRVPDYMVPWFGMRPLRARQLGVKVVDGLAVSEGAWVYPCLRVLPMGFAWAMRWTQQAHRELLRRGGLGGIESELVDRQIAPSVDSPQVPRVVYVDNEIFVSSRPGATRGARRQAAKVMAEAGLPLREVEESKTVVEALGLELDGIKLRARLARAKRWRSSSFTHAMLLNRPALCVFRSAYDFARKHYRAPVPLWPSVRQELANALHLVPLLAVQFDLPWSGRVTCSDATLRGYAVQEADMEPSAVREVGRWSERWRFRIQSTLRPREVYIMYTQPCLYGFLKALVEPLVVKRFWIYLWLVLLGPLGPLRKEFPEIPKGFISEGSWRTIQARRLRRRWMPGDGGPLERQPRGRAVGTGGLTTLEQEGIAQATRQDYERRLDRFDVFCRTHGLTTASDVELKKAVGEYMELPFNQGEPSSSGAKLRAAIRHRGPGLHHAGRQLKLPRMARALQGWRGLVRPLAWAPAPWAALAALAVALIDLGQRRAALGVMLAADAYLRPRELLTLRADHRVLAQPRAGGDYRFTSLELRPKKELQSAATKGFSDSILLNSPAKSFVGPRLEQIVSQSQPVDLLSPWSGADFNAMFKVAAALFGLKSWELTRRRASLHRGRQLLLAEADQLLEGALGDGRTNGFAR